MNTQLPTLLMTYFPIGIYIRTLGRIDKEKAREFEKKYSGQPYDTLRAGLAGLDIDFIDKYLFYRYF